MTFEIIIANDCYKKKWNLVSLYLLFFYAKLFRFIDTRVSATFSGMF